MSTPDPHAGSERETLVAELMAWSRDDIVPGDLQELLLAAAALLAAPSPSEERAALKEENHRLALDLMQEESEGNILADQVQKLTERAATLERALREIVSTLTSDQPPGDKLWFARRSAERALAPASPSVEQERIMRALSERATADRIARSAPLVLPEPQPEEQG